MSFPRRRESTAPTIPKRNNLQYEKVFGEIARQVAQEAMTVLTSPEGSPYMYDAFKPKGQMTLEPMVFQKLNEDNGIEFYIAAEQPQGVPDENWLPINRQDEVLDMVMRIYAPDMEKITTWKVPFAERVE